MKRQADTRPGRTSALTKTGRSEAPNHPNLSGGYRPEAGAESPASTAGLCLCRFGHTSVGSEYARPVRRKTWSGPEKLPTFMHVTTEPLLQFRHIRIYPCDYAVRAPDTAFPWAVRRRSRVVSLEIHNRTGNIEDFPPLFKMGDLPGNRKWHDHPPAYYSVDIAADSPFPRQQPSIGIKLSEMTGEKILGCGFEWPGIICASRRCKHKAN